METLFSYSTLDNKNLTLLAVSFTYFQLPLATYINFHKENMTSQSVQSFMSGHY